MSEAMSPPPESVSNPEQIKAELDAVYDHLIKKFGEKNPEDFTDEDRSHVVAILESMIVRFGADNVWDGLILHDAEESHVDQARNIEIDMNKLQEDQAKRIELAENGDPEMQWAATFGMFEAGYVNAIGDDNLIKIHFKARVDALLVGAMTPQTVNEYGKFCQTLNGSTVPTVLDKVDYSLREADPNLVRTLHADATQMPLPDKSQDLIFTNLLLGWLSKEGKLPSGEIISKVLQEMTRVVKDDGMVVMAEKSPTSKEHNTYSWLTVLLIEASLKDLGFRSVRDHDALLYRGHTHKKKGDFSQVIVDKRSGKCDDCDKTHYNPFCFITAAKRDARPIPMEDLTSPTSDVSGPKE